MARRFTRAQPNRALAVEKDAAIAASLQGAGPGAIAVLPCEDRFWEVLAAGLHQLAHVTGTGRQPNPTGRGRFCVAWLPVGAASATPTAR